MNKINRTYTFHSDSKHGWLEVKEEDIFLVGLKVKDFSLFSYRKQNHFFLEEYHDSRKFVKRFISKFGNPPKFLQAHTDGSFPKKFQLDCICCDY